MSHPIWTKRLRIPFSLLLEQAIRSSFTCIFLNWAGIYIDDPSMTVIVFVDWLSFDLGDVNYLFIFLFSSFLLVCWLALYLWYVLLCSFIGTFLICLFVLLIKKRGNNMWFYLLSCTLCCVNSCRYNVKISFYWFCL